MPINNQTELKWTKKLGKILVGKTIKKVQYLSREDAQKMGWYKRPLVIVFTDGSFIYAMRDDEGNDAGAMWGRDEEENEITIPVIT